MLNFQQTIRDVFASGVQEIGVDQLNAMIDSALAEIITKEDKMIFDRFKYWVKTPDHESHLVCCDIEFARFGFMDPCKIRSTGENDSIVNHDHLVRDLDRYRVEFSLIKRSRSDVELAALTVDAVVERDLVDGMQVPLPLPVVESSGSKDIVMAHIPVHEIPRVFSRIDKTHILKTIAMAYYYAYMVYAKHYMINTNKNLKWLDDEIKSHRGVWVRLVNSSKSKDGDLSNAIELLSTDEDMLDRLSYRQDEAMLLLEANKAAHDSQMQEIEAKIAIVEVDADSVESEHNAIWNMTTNKTRMTLSRKKRFRCTNQSEYQSLLDQDKDPKLSGKRWVMKRLYDSAVHRGDPRAAEYKTKYDALE